MRFCKIENNIKQGCNTSLGGIEKLYLINQDDYLDVNYDILKLNEGATFYEIDSMHNSARFVQTAVNGVNGTYINNTLSFIVKSDAENLEDNLDALLLGEFKVLVKYRNGYWRFVSEQVYENFKQNSFTLDSGAAEGDLNALTVTMQCNTHTFGLLFESMPKFDNNNSTEPNWVVVEEICETR